MRKQLKFLKNQLARVIRDVERNTASYPEILVEFISTLRKAHIIAGQNLNRHAKPKINSWDALEVECIGKGKGRTPYEFGCKFTIAGTAGLVPRVERLFLRQMLRTVTRLAPTRRRGPKTNGSPDRHHSETRPR